MKAPNRRGGGAALLAATALTLAAACGGGSSAKPTPSPAATQSVVAGTATPDAGDATRIAASPASLITPALLQVADLPPRLPRLGGNVQSVRANDVPGLTSVGVVNGARFVTTTSDEFLNETAIVPDDRASVQSMLDQFGSGAYLSGLTGGATDAQSSPMALSGAPVSAKGLHYNGTSKAGGASGRVEGEAIAFVHGRVFVLVVHAARLPQLPPLDLTALAMLIDQRLALIPEVN